MLHPAQLPLLLLRRTGRVGLLTAMVIAMVVAATPAPASDQPVAAMLDVQCEGTQTNAFDPGITLVEQAGQITTDIVLAPCASPTAPAVIAGTDLDEVITTTYSCFDLLSGPPGAITRVITWNTGQTSTFVHTVVVERVAAQTIVTRTGTITAGLFAGDTAVMETVVQNPRADQCAQPGGVKRLRGVTTFTALHP